MELLRLTQYTQCFSLVPEAAYRVKLRLLEAQRLLEALLFQLKMLSRIPDQDNEVARRSKIDPLIASGGD